MPSAVYKPVIFLACTNDATGKAPLPKSVAGCELIADILAPYAGQEGCEIMESRQGSPLYPEDVFSQRPKKSQVAILQLLGESRENGSLAFRSRSGERLIHVAELGEILGSFPQLQLAILSGPATDDLVKQLLCRGVPAVLSFPDADRQQAAIREFYYALLEGQNLRQAYQATAQVLPDFPYYEVTYEAAKDSLSWGSRETPTFSRGLIARTNNLRSLNWRLRNPLLIPVSEQRALAADREQRLKKLEKERPLGGEKREGLFREDIPLAVLQQEVRSEEPTPELVERQDPPSAQGEPTPEPPLSQVPPETSPVATPPEAETPPESEPEEKAPAPEAEPAAEAAPPATPPAAEPPADPAPELPKAETPPLKADTPPKRVGKPAKRPTTSKPVQRKRPQKQKPVKPSPQAAPAPVIEEPATPLQRPWLRRGLQAGAGLLGLSALLVVLALVFPEAARQTRQTIRGWFNQGEVDSFAVGAGAYRVLVLPFHEQTNCAPILSEATQATVARLEAMRETDETAIAARFLEVTNCKDLASMAPTLAQTYTADLVIWGLARTDSTLPETMLELGFYAASGYGEGLYLQGRDGWYLPMRRAAAEPGIVAVEIQNLVRWAQGVRRMTGENYPDAIAAFERIETDVLATQAAVSKMLSQCYIRDGKFQEARDHFDQIVQLQPNDPRLRLERGKLLAQLGEYPAALEDYSKALESEPDNLDALINRAMVYADMKEYREALADFGAVLELNPEFSPVYVSRAEVYRQMGQPYAALRDLGKAIEISQEYPVAYYRRGLLHQELGQETKAKEDIEAALRIDPNYTAARLFTGDVLVTEEAYDQALLAYSQVVESQSSAEAHFKRGHVHYLVGAYMAAIEDFSAALRLDEGYVDAWYERGRTREAMGEHLQAITDLDQALHIQPNHAPALYGRGLVHAAMGNSRAALADFSQSIKINPQEAAPYYMRALQYLDLDSLAAALADANEAVRIASREAAPYLYRGRVYEAQGETSRAIQDYGRSLRYDQDLAEAYYRRGALYYKSNQSSAARRDLNKAVELKTTYTEAYMLLSELLEPDDPQVTSLFAQALAIDSTDAKVYLARGDYLLEVKAYAEAINAYGRVLALSPKSDNLPFLQRGMAYVAMGNENLALVDFNKAIRAYPDSAAPYTQRGRLYLRMDKLPQAEEDLIQAASLNPQSAEVRYLQGGLYARQEQYEQALAAFAEAIGLNPREAAAYNERGKVYFSLEQYGLAQQDYNQALRLEQDFAEAFFNRAELWRKQGRYDAALRDYSQALEENAQLADAYYYRGFIHYLQEDYETAIPDVSEAIRLRPGESIWYGLMAKIYARQGDQEQFYSYLEMAIKQGYPLMELKQVPAFKPYQEETRFQNLLNQSF